MNHPDFNLLVTVAQPLPQRVEGVSSVSFTVSPYWVCICTHTSLVLQHTEPWSPGLQIDMSQVCVHTKVVQCMQKERECCGWNWNSNHTPVCRRGWYPAWCYWELVQTLQSRAFSATFRSLKVCLLAWLCDPGPIPFLSCLIQGWVGYISLKSYHHRPKPRG